MSLEKVQQALLTKFKADYGTAFANQIAYENLAFTPPKGKPWLSVHFMPADSSVATLGANGRDTENGIFQISLYTPQGVGEASIRQTVNAFRVSFKPQVLTFEGQPVSIISRSRANGGTRDGFYVVPFTVRWRAQLSRS